MKPIPRPVLMIMAAVNEAPTASYLPRPKGCSEVAGFRAWSSAHSVHASESKSLNEWPASATSAEEPDIMPAAPFAIATPPLTAAPILVIRCPSSTDAEAVER